MIAECRLFLGRGISTVSDFASKTAFLFAAGMKSTVSKPQCGQVTALPESVVSNSIGALEREIIANLTKYSPDTLRRSGSARRETASKAQDILARISGYLPAAPAEDADSPSEPFDPNPFVPEFVPPTEVQDMALLQVESEDIHAVHSQFTPTYSVPSSLSGGFLL